MAAESRQKAPAGPPGAARSRPEGNREPNDKTWVPNPVIKLRMNKKCDALFANTPLRMFKKPWCS